MNTPLKSRYELLLEKYEHDGKLKTYTDEENLAVIANLNKGMDDFLYEQKLNEKASEQELADIILNA